jgi:hypothetical protein
MLFSIYQNKLNNMSNTTLNHAQREGRRIPVTAANASDYECPVCYTTDPSAGVVSPACRHKICITCYSTVLLQGGAGGARCPSCRADYPRSSLITPNPATAPAPAPAPAPVDLVYQRHYESRARELVRLQILENEQILATIRACHADLQEQHILRADPLLLSQFSQTSQNSRADPLLLRADPLLLSPVQPNGAPWWT